MINVRPLNFKITLEFYNLGISKASENRQTNPKVTLRNEPKKRHSNLLILSLLSFKIDPSDLIHTLKTKRISLAEKQLVQYQLLITVIFFQLKITVYF